MFSEASQRLADDHSALDEVLSGLRKALANGDVADSHARLDLFWARLAVHIRAEHLHLFPAIINGMSKSTDDQAGAPTQTEGQRAVERLRADHDFFMHELAAAIATLPDLNQVATMVNAVEKRLTTHNELEETQIYGLIGSILSQEEQAKLASQIDAELMKHPPRFSERTWVG